VRRFIQHIFRLVATHCEKIATDFKEFAIEQFARGRPTRPGAACNKKPERALIDQLINEAFPSF